MIISIWRWRTARELIDYVDTPKEGGEECVPIGSNVVPKRSPKAGDRFEAIAGRRPEVVKPFVHLMLSPGSVEFDPRHWHRIVQDALDRLGLSARRHVYYAGLHVKQGRQHCHVAVCRVGIDRSVWLREQEWLRAVEVARELAASYGTTSPYADLWERAAPHRSVVQVNRILQREGEEPIEVREIVERLTACLSGTRTSAEFVKTAKRDAIELDFRLDDDGKIVGIRFLAKTRRRHRLKLSTLTSGLFSLRTLEAFYGEESGPLRAHLDKVSRRFDAEQGAELPEHRPDDGPGTGPDDEPGFRLDDEPESEPDDEPESRPDDDEEGGDAPEGDGHPGPDRPRG